MVTTKQIPKADTLKMKRRESKHATMENQQVTKEGSKRGRKEQRDYRTSRKQQDGISKSSPFSNYSKCKWVHLPIQRHRVAKWIFEKTQLYGSQSIRDKPRWHSFGCL